MNGLVRERQVLELLIPTLEEEGYSVYAQPPRQLLPAFMDGYVPDAIALGKPKNLAIEIVRDNSTSPARETSLSERFSGVSDWELRVIYIRPSDNRVPIGTVSTDLIDNTIAKVEWLVAAGQPEAAVLLGWSAFEAIGRKVAPIQLPQAQSPTNLVELLATEGIVTPDEAEQLRPFATLRNLIAHGALATSIAPDEALAFTAILKLVMQENRVDAAPH